MPIINNPFNGKMNLDVADYRIDNNDYIDALNITKDAEGVGQDRVVSNILGNTNIAYSLPSGTNKVIGFYPDKIRNRAYYFVWNSNGYNTILYLDLNTNTIIKVLQSITDSDGIDILNFNPSYKVLSVNLYYRDIEGDLLFFNDGLNPPKVINVIENHGTSWKYEYLLVAKAPPQMPPKVVYQNDKTVKANNLRNVLFQFCYRFVYQNNEKSVWSSKSIVPLPQQPSANLTDIDLTLNSNISISMSTGGINVKKIELAFRETTNGLTSDWYLISSFDKAALGILNNDIYTFNFYNDSIYNAIDIVDMSQLQDWVPQRANAGELANGNVLLYAGITEGYDKTNMNLVASAQRQLPPYFFDKCGLLFFAASEGVDSGVKSTRMKVFIFGTVSDISPIITTTTTSTTTIGPTTTTTLGPTTTTTLGPTTTTTTTSPPQGLDNPDGIYVINAINNSGTNIGISYNYSTNLGISIHSLLNNISFLLQSNGWTQIGSISSNYVTMEYASGFTLLSSGVQLSGYSKDNTVFANSWDSGYQYALQYFDSVGRTIGAQTSDLASFNTPSSNGYKYPTTLLQIKNRPPLEAVYYQILRSNNTTYNKRLFWISNSAYRSVTSLNPFASGVVEGFAYISVDNIALYNQQISSTSSVVSYSFAPGDRIRFIQRFDAENNPISFNTTTVYDYEVVGTVSSIVTPNSNKTGDFIKIKYPKTDVDANSSNFNFDGDLNYMHYEILLYNYTNNASSTQRVFYEFGKCFGIGNPGTSNAYHIGLEQTQSATDPVNVPAYITCTNGDLFYRSRKVVTSYDYIYTGGNQDVKTANNVFGGYIAILNLVEKFEQSPLGTSTSFALGNQDSTAGAGTLSIDPAYFPTSYSDTNNLFWNKSNQNIIINLNFSGRASYDTTNILLNKVLFYIYYVDSVDKRYNEIYTNNTVDSTGEIFICKDWIVSVPPYTKIYIGVSGGSIGQDVSAVLNAFDFNISVLNYSNIDIIESSFSDTYNLVTNSNGRPSVIDINASKKYFPTTIRFGQSYEFNTNINGLNRFYFENFDEYDRSFGDVMRLHVRDRYLKVYQKFKVGNVPILTQIVKDSSNNPLQANTDTLINKIQYYEGNYGIGDASTSLAWNNFADYFVDDYRGVVCRLSQNGIEPLSIIYHTNAFFVAKLKAYRQDLNNGIAPTGEVYTGNPCIYGAFDSYTNKYILALEEINRYLPPTTTTTTTAAPPPCLCYSAVFGSTGGEINYVDCNLINHNYVSTGASTYYQCVVREGGVDQIFVVSGDVTLTLIGNCADGCSAPTTTTTSTTSTTSTTTTTTTTAAPTTTTTTLAYTSIGRGSVITSETDCTQTTSTVEMFLNASDYAKFVSNGGCLSNDGVNTVSVIRNSDGTNIVGTYYFVYYGSSCSTTTFKTTNGNLTVNPYQC